MTTIVPDQGVDSPANLSGGSPAQCIGFHVGSPLLKLALELNLMPGFSPSGNVIGTYLLWRMMEQALLAGGLMRENICGVQGADINDCTFKAIVTDSLEAIEIVKRELKSVGLLDFCQIGIMGKAGWQCVYPSKGIRLEWLLDSERLELAAAKFLEAQAKGLESVRELARQLQGNNPEQGGKQ